MEGVKPRDNDKERKERRALALFDLIEREKEKERVAKRSLLEERIKLQHVKITQWAQLLEKKRVERNKNLITSRQNYIHARRRALVAIHAPDVVVRGDESKLQSTSGGTATSTDGHRGTAVGDNKFETRGSNRVSTTHAGGKRVSVLCARDMLLNPTPSSQSVATFRRMETLVGSSQSIMESMRIVADVRASRPSVMNSTRGLRSLSVATKPDSRNPADPETTLHEINSSFSQPRARQASTLSSNAGILAQRQNESVLEEEELLVEETREYGNVQRKIFKSKAYKRCVFLSSKQRERKNAKILPPSKRFFLKVKKPKVERKTHESTDQEEWCAKKPKRQYNLDEITKANRKLFATVRAKTVTRSSNFSSGQKTQLRRTSMMPTRQCVPGTGPNSVFQTDAIYREFKLKYQVPPAIEKQEDIDSVDVVHNYAIKRVSRKREMWEQAQKNRARKNAFAFGGGLHESVLEPAQYAQGMATTFAKEFLHAVPLRDSREPKQLLNAQPNESISSSLLQPRSSSVLSATITDELGPVARRSTIESSERSSPKATPQRAGSPTANNRSHGAVSERITSENPVDRNGEVAMNIAQSKIATSRRGLLLSAKERSSRSTTATARHQQTQDNKKNPEKEANRRQTEEFTTENDNFVVERPKQKPEESSQPPPSSDQRFQAHSTLTDYSNGPAETATRQSSGVGSGGHRERVGSGRVTFKGQREEEGFSEAVSKTNRLLGRASESHFSAKLATTVNTLSNGHSIPALRNWQPLNLSALAEMKRTVLPKQVVNTDCQLKLEESLPRIRLRPSWNAAGSIFPELDGKIGTYSKFSEDVDPPKLLRVWRT